MDNKNLYELNRGSFLKKSNDGKYIAIINSKIEIWDAIENKVIYIYKDLKNASSLAFSSNSKYLAAKNTSGEISLYDLRKAKKVKSFMPTRSEGTKMFFTSDDNYIISADWNGCIYMIDINKRKVKMIKKYKGCMISDIDYNSSLNKYMFLITTIGDKSDEKGSYSILLEWTYPFSDNKYTEKQVDWKMWKIKYNKSNDDGYVAICNFQLIAYNKDFEIIKIRPNVVRNASINIDVSSTGEYLLFSNGNGFEIIKYSDFSKAKSIRIKKFLFAEFTRENNHEGILCGTNDKSCYLDLKRLISK